MVQLAQTTWMAGPRDELATADVYTQRTGAVINSIQKLAADGGEWDLASMLRGGESLMQALPIIQGFSAQGLSLNKDNLVARLMAGSGTVVAGLRNMPSSMAGKIAGNIPTSNHLFATVDGVVRRVDTAQLSDLTSVGRTIGEVCGDPQLFTVQDQNAQIGVFSGLILEATRFGIPNTFGSLMSGIANPYVLTRVAQSVLPAIINGSDLPSLQSIASIMLPGSTRMIYPRVIPDFNRRYRVSPGSGQQQRHQDFGTVLGTYSAIDPNWNRHSRTLESGATDSVLAVHSLQNASEDMRQMIAVGAQKSAVAEEKLYVLANVFPATTVDDELRREFPLSLVGPSQRSTRPVSDPRGLLG